MLRDHPRTISCYTQYDAIGLDEGLHAYVMSSHLDGDLRNAFILKERGADEEALTVLLDLYDKGEWSEGFAAVLGSWLADAGMHERALKVLREATNRAPTAEMISLSLFHSLLDAKREVEAFSEMRRFLAVAESLEYRRLLRDLGRA
jgi:hypothetical protein